MEFSLQKARNLAARTVHIKISPTPQTFTERRVVLQELEQKFGEVAMFRSLKVCSQWSLCRHLANIRLAVPSHSSRPKCCHSDFPDRKRSQSGSRESQPPIRPDNRALSSHHLFRRTPPLSSRIQSNVGRSSSRKNPRGAARSKGVPTQYLALRFCA